MVKIFRSKHPPILRFVNGANRGQNKCSVKTQALFALYAANRNNYNNGTASFVFDDALLRDPVFITVFKNSQNNKCCYCQNDLDPGIVEHYRPKARYQQKRKGKLYYPGYYWLAYEWSNLLFACFGCNTSYKGTLFPLYENRNRAKNHLANIAHEDPVIINPLVEDPTTYLWFKKEKIRSRGTRKRGQKNIKILGLDRSNLQDERREYLNDIVGRRESLRLAIGSANEAIARDRWKAYINEKKKKYNKFSAMVNDNFKSASL